MEDILQRSLDFIGFPDYVVYSDGTIYSKLSNKFLKLSNNGKGYLKVVLCNKGYKKQYSVHRIVLSAFVTNLDVTREYVNHIDGCKTNNRLENLEWTTPKENNDHALRTGLKNISYRATNREVSDDVAHKICKLILLNYTNNEIISELKVPNHVVAKIRFGTNYTDIVSQYNFSKVRSPRRQLKDTQVVEICLLIKQGFPVKEIQNITNVSQPSIRNILKKIHYTDISKDYF